MIEGLTLFGQGFAAVYALWIFYLAGMNLIRAHELGTITKTALVFGYPVIAVGLILDFLVNVFILSFILLEPPKEFLVTKRLQRHFKESHGWRYSVARFICSELLDTFDPSGTHCS